MNRPGDGKVATANKEIPPPRIQGEHNKKVLRLEGLHQ